MLTEKITLDIDGVKYEGRLATIRKTFIGREGHGIPTAFIATDGEVFSQDAGGYDLRNENMYVFVMGVVDALGVDSWEKLPGLNVMLLYLDNNARFPIVGIKKAVGGKPFLFKQALEAGRLDGD